MANEARITSSLQIVKAPITYLSQPTAFTADVDGTKGPCIGAFTASVYGTIVDFSQLTTPGLYRVQNQDDANYVEWGLYDPDSDKFYPKEEVGPGETYVGKFSRNLLERYEGTGTGTSSPTMKIMFKANTANVEVLLEVFER